ncbi:MAG: amidohydrolase family protein, partial [Endomicrobiia bacterium]|nr:amidohydrolase family protein [Endomicrobiia bacterium]
MRDSISELIKAASGKIRPDLCLKNGRVINVLSGEIERADILVHKGYIASVGRRLPRARRSIDIKGAFVAPGFIDGHAHIESSMMSVSEFARAVSSRGVTSVITDAHEIANVLGIDGIKYMLESAKYQPLSVFFMLPSCVPATKMETAGARLSGFDLYPFLKEKWVVGLGEVMNFPGVILADEDLLDKMKIAVGKRIDGHAPGLSGASLAAYIASGITSDHESTTLDEAREKLRRGMYVMVREGTSEKNLASLIPLVNEKNYPRFFFVSDDRHPHDLVKEGSIDHLIRKAVSLGLDPITAIRMATLNTAEYFRLPRIGAVAPGYQADITVFDKLKDIRPKLVIRRGEIVGALGKFVGRKVKIAAGLRGSVNVRWLDEKDFRIPAEGRRIKVIEIVPHQIITRKITARAKVVGGMAVSDTAA